MPGTTFHNRGSIIAQYTYVIYIEKWPCQALKSLPGHCPWTPSRWRCASLASRTPLGIIIHNYFPPLRLGWLQPWSYNSASHKQSCEQDTAHYTRAERWAPRLAHAHFTFATANVRSRSTTSREDTTCHILTSGLTSQSRDWRTCAHGDVTIAVAELCYHKSCSMQRPLDITHIHMTLPLPADSSRWGPRAFLCIISSFVFSLRISLLVYFLWGFYKSNIPYIDRQFRH